MYPTIKPPTCQTPFTKPSHTNQPSSTATMPQPSPSPQETQPFSQPSSTATMASTRNSALPPSHPAQRRWLSPHLQTTGNSAFPPSHPAQRRWLIQLPGIHSILQPSSIPTSASRPTPPPLPPARNRTAGETGAGLLRLCRRGDDSWLAEICVVFKKSAV